MYPAQPSFLADDPYALWWQVNRASGVDICSVNAASWLLTVRRALGVNGSAVWDGAFASALVNAATVLERQDASWSGVRAALAAEAQASRPGLASFVFATWFAFYRPNRLRYDILDVSPDLVLPAWGQVVRPPTRSRDSVEGNGLTCYRPSTETPPAALSNAERRGVEQASSIGVRVRPGEATEQSETEIDTGPSAIPPWAVAVGAVSLVAIAAALVMIPAKTSSPRRRRR